MPDAANISGTTHIDRYLTTRKPSVPYATNADLPKQVRDALPGDAQTRFRQVVNDALGRDQSDSRAFASAWSVISNGWKKGKNGKWVRKAGVSAVYKDAAKPLFLSRKLENAADLIAWAKDQGFDTALQDGDMHATIAYSKEPLVWPEASVDGVTVYDKEDRSVEPLGDNGAVVLRFKSPTLEARWSELRDQGASWDHEGFTPHITITWDNAGGPDPATITPYDGPLVFGPEIMKEIDPDWSDTVTEKDDKMKTTQKAGARHSSGDRGMIQKIHDHAVSLGADCQATEKAVTKPADPNVEFSKRHDLTVLKVDEELGLVFGWAIVSKDQGEDYFDVQGDHIPEDSMLKASTDFMLSDRVGKEMHAGDAAGTIVFAWPLTTDIAKAMGLETDRTGLMIAWKPNDIETLAKFKSGEYSGFSIGGQRLVDEEIDA